MTTTEPSPTDQPKPSAEEPAIIGHLRNCIEGWKKQGALGALQTTFTLTLAEVNELDAWLKSAPEPSELTARKHENAIIPRGRAAWCPDCGALKHESGMEWLTPDPFKLRAHEIETLRGQLEETAKAKDLAEQREREARRTAEEWRCESKDNAEAQERTRQEREKLRRERDEARAELDRLKLHPLVAAELLPGHRPIEAALMLLDKMRGDEHKLDAICSERDRLRRDLTELTESRDRVEAERLRLVGDLKHAEELGRERYFRIKELRDELEAARGNAEKSVLAALRHLNLASAISAPEDIGIRARLQAAADALRPLLQLDPVPEPAATPDEKCPACNGAGRRPIRLEEGSPKAPCDTCGGSGKKRDEKAVPAGTRTTRKSPWCRRCQCFVAVHEGGCCAMCGEYETELRDRPTPTEKTTTGPAAQTRNEAQTGDKSEPGALKSSKQAAAAGHPSNPRAESGGAPERLTRKNLEIARVIAAHIERHPQESDELFCRWLRLNARLLLAAAERDLNIEPQLATALGVDVHPIEELLEIARALREEAEASRALEEEPPRASDEEQEKRLEAIEKTAACHWFPEGVRVLAAEVAAYLRAELGAR